MPRSNIAIIWTPNEWYVVRCGTKNNYQKKIGLGVQNMLTILSSIVKMIGGHYDHLTSTRIHNLIMNKIFMWALKLIRKSQRTWFGFANHVTNCMFRLLEEVGAEKSIRMTHIYLNLLQRASPRSPDGWLKTFNSVKNVTEYIIDHNHLHRFPKSSLTSRGSRCRMWNDLKENESTDSPLEEAFT